MTIHSVLRVTEPAADRGLLTADQLREVGITGDDDDAVLAKGLRYSARIARICRIVADGAIPPTLRLESLRETFTVDDDQHYQRLMHGDRGPLVLARRPLVTLTSITLNGNFDLPIDSNLIVDDAQGMLIREPQRSFFWPHFHSHYGIWGRQAVVEYQAGWDEVPDDLVLAVQQYIREATARADREIGLRRLSIPNVEDRDYWNDESAGGASNIVLDMLDPYINKVL
jgi:hypothetical protein